jgi:hypothetical protein
VIFSDSLVEITAEYAFENDVINYLRSFQNQKLSDLPIGKVYKKLMLTFDYFGGVQEAES